MLDRNVILDKPPVDGRPCAIVILDEAFAESAAGIRTEQAVDTPAVKEGRERQRLSITRRTIGSNHYGALSAEVGTDRCCTTCTQELVRGWNFCPLCGCKLSSNIDKVTVEPVPLPKRR